MQMQSLTNTRVDKKLLIIVGFCIVFFFIYLWFSYRMPSRFASPDETANYFFGGLFAQHNSLRYHEPLNTLAGALVIPRSMTLVNGYTVPVSFLGLPMLYGAIAKFTGIASMTLFTPFMAAVSVVFFYLLLKQIFSKTIAFYSSLMLFILPPFWYYASRGMFHNSLFVSLIIVGLYFLLHGSHSKRSKGGSTLLYFLSGIFFGLALAVRTSEAPWVVIMLLLMGILHKARIRLFHVLIFLGASLLVFAPIFFYNHQLYGSWDSFGYAPLPSVSDISVSVTNVVSHSDFERLWQLILPFGLNFHRMSVAAYQYLFLFSPIFSLLLIIGILLLVRRVSLPFIVKFFPHVDSHPPAPPLPRPQVIYALVFFVISLWLIIYYGSYIFTEFSDQSVIVLGSSYLRYWLPIYIFGIPFFIFGLQKLASFFKNGVLGRMVVVSVVAIFLLGAAMTVLFDASYGLVPLKENMKQNNNREKIVESRTESASVIISGTADKLFFPQRKVIVNLPSDITTRDRFLDALLRQTTVYFYFDPFVGNSALDDITSRGFSASPVVSLSKNGEILYRIGR